MKIIRVTQIVAGVNFDTTKVNIISGETILEPSVKDNRT